MSQPSCPRHPLVTPTGQSWEPFWNACGLGGGGFLRNETEAERGEDESEPEKSEEFRKDDLSWK